MLTVEHVQVRVAGRLPAHQAVHIDPPGLLGDTLVVEAA